MRIRDITSAVAGGIAVAAIAAAVGTLSTGAANAATGGPAHRTTAVTRTCHAFATWNAHRTTANLNAMMVASVTTPYPGLGLDVEVLYGTVKLGNRSDTPDAVHAVIVDCKL